MLKNRSNVAMGAIVILAGAAGWVSGSKEDGAAKALRGVETAASKEFRPRARAVTPSERTSPDQVVSQYLERDSMGADRVAQLDLWRVISGYSAEQCRAMLTVLDPADPSERFQIHAMLFSRLAEIDPVEAMKEAGFQPESMAPTFRHTVLSTWLRDDPEAACRWAIRNLDQKERGMLPYQLAAVLADYGPREAFRRASALGGEFAPAVLNKQGAAVAGNEKLKEEFLELLKGQPEDVRKAATKMLLLAEAKINPEQALVALGDFGLAEEKGRSSTRSNILRGWLERDSPAAMSWVEGNPGGLSAGERAELFQRWNREYPEQALEWLETQPKPGTLAMGLTKNLYGSVLGNTFDQFGSEEAKTKASQDFVRSYQLWSSERPEEAEKWRSSMVPSVRDMLEGGMK